MVQRTLLCLILLLAPAGPAAARGPLCSHDEIARAAEQVAGARKAMLALPIGDGTETDVPLEARRAVASMKTRLGGFVIATMRCVPANADPAAIERELSTLARASDTGPETDASGAPSEESGNYGFRLSFMVRSQIGRAQVGQAQAGRVQVGRPRIIGITAKFQIECGSDTMLFVFTRDGDNGWTEVLRWQSKPYKTVAGAFDAFDYAISPPDHAGRWFVVAKSIAPWCSSTWSMIRYAVLRPAPNGVRPRELLGGSDPIWWGDDDLGRLTVGREDFDLRFHAGSIDLDINNRVWIRHFSVVGNTVQRIQPVAVSPRDFVDEWIISPWQRSARWSSAKAGALENLHDRLRKIRVFDYASVRQCTDAPDHTQIELRRDDDQSPYYFQVLGSTTYTMASVSTKPASACNGANTLETMTTR